MSAPDSQPEVIVAKVSWWVHLVPVFVAIIGLIQAAGFLWVGNSVQHTTSAVIGVKSAVAGVEEKVTDTTRAVDQMEKQINSNMERQIKSAIEEAIAKYRLGLLEDKMEENKAKAKEEAAESLE